MSSFWKYLGLGSFSWFIGMIIWSYLEIVEKIALPYPALSDLFFILASPFYIWAFVSIKKENQTKQASLKEMAEVIFFLGGSIVIINSTHYLPISNTNKSIFYILTSLVHGFLSLILFIFSFITFLEANSKKKRNLLMCISISTLFHSVADIIYSYQLIHGFFNHQNFVNYLWVLSFSFLIMGQILYRKKWSKLSNLPLESNLFFASLRSSMKGLFGLTALFTIIFFFNEPDFLGKMINSFGVFLIFTALILNGLVETLTIRKYEKEILNIGKKYKETSFSLDIFKKALDEHVIISVTNPKGKITYANKKFCDLSKFSEEELVGNDHRLVKSGYHDKKFMENLWSSIASGKMWKGRLKNRSKNGDFYWVDTTIVPIFNSKGEIKSYLSLRTDVTELVNSREEIRSKLFNLEAFQNLKSDFLSLISHELKTPLNHITGVSQSLLDSKITDDQREEINNQIRACDNLANLIDNLIIIGGKETDEEFNNECFEVLKLIEESFQAVSYLASGKELKLCYHLQNIPSKVFGSPNALYQILYSFLSNSVKFSHKGKILLTVSKFDSDLTFHLKDEGLGMSEKELKKSFDSFYQEDLSISRKGQGLGLGLNVAKILLNKVRGKFRITSEEGTGTDIYLDIPFEVEKGAPPLDIESEVPIGEIAQTNKVKQHSPKKNKILVVDDSDANLNIISRFLLTLDVDLTLAKDGQEGVDQFLKQKFDLVLMDIQMPVLNGIEATIKIREIEKKNNLKRTMIFAVSAFSISEADRIIKEGGFDLFIPKPIRRKSFIDKIKEACVL